MERTVKVRLDLATAGYMTGLAQTSSATVGAARTMQTGMTGMTRSVGGGLKGMVGSLGIVNASLLGAGGLVAGVTAVTKAGISWESAFAGVKKTVDGTPQQLQAINDGLQRMSTTIPTSKEELAGIAEIAGQLGIETDNVLEFTRTIADLGETTDLTGEQGATMLAQFANITQMDQSNFDRLGSVIVDLGNNSATTESKIAEMSQRIAAAGTQAGMSEADILGIATALSSVGIEAEAGGTAVTKTINEIQREVELGGAKLAAFAEVAGMAPAAFAEAWRTDSAAAFGEFISGLGKIADEGGSVNAVLEELEITEIRQSDAMRRLSGDADALTGYVDRANTAWAENTALTDEAAQRYETTAAKIDMAKNAVGLLATELGSQLLPAISDTADGVAGLALELLDLFRMEVPDWFGGGSDASVGDALGFGIRKVASAVNPLGKAMWGEDVRTQYDAFARGQRVGDSTSAAGANAIARDRRPFVPAERADVGTVSSRVNLVGVQDAIADLKAVEVELGKVRGNSDDAGNALARVSTDMQGTSATAANAIAANAIAATGAVFESGMTAAERAAARLWEYEAALDAISGTSPDAANLRAVSDALEGIRGTSTDAANLVALSGALGGISSTSPDAANGLARFGEAAEVQLSAVDRVATRTGEYEVVLGSAAGTSTDAANAIAASSGTIVATSGEAANALARQPRVLAEVDVATQAATDRMTGYAEMLGYTTERSTAYVDTSRTLEEATETASAMFELAEVRLSAMREEIAGAVDPVVGLRNAIEAADEAQDHYNEVVSEHGAASKEAEDAAFALASAVATAEQAAINGDLSFDEFSAKLDEWVAQGKITEQAADTLRDRVKDLRGEAEDYRGNYDAAFKAETEGAMADLETLRNYIDRLPRTINIRAQLSYDTAEANRFNAVSGMYGRPSHDGGPIDPTVGVTAVGLLPNERMVRAEVGEYVVRKEQVPRHMSTLQAINAGVFHQGGQVGTVGAMPSAMPPPPAMLPGAAPPPAPTVNNATNNNVTVYGPVDHRTDFRLRDAIGAH